MILFLYTCDDKVIVISGTLLRRESNRLIFPVQVRFGFAPVKNISKTVYKVPVQVRSKNSIILVIQFKK